MKKGNKERNKERKQKNKEINKERKKQRKKETHSKHPPKTHLAYLTSMTQIHHTIFENLARLTSMTQIHLRLPMLIDGDSGVIYIFPVCKYRTQISNHKEGF
jgi:hypothetical protein